MLTTTRSPGTMLPLSVAQRGLWVSSKLAPPDIVFNIAEAIEIHGPVDTVHFMRALTFLAGEIEPSRTRIVEEPSGPKQIIEEHFEGECPLLDVSREPAPFERAIEWMRAELSRPVEFRRDRLWTSALIRLGPAHYMWYHRCHHVVMDGFSGGLIAKRLASLYNASLAGEPLPPSPFGKLADLLEAETAYRSSDRHARDRAYWLEQLAGLPEPVSLARRRRPGTGPLRRHTATLDADLTRRLMGLSREIGGTLPQILIALVAIYVYRITGADDLTLGMPVTGRVGHAMRAIPAMVANAVVMRFRFTPRMVLSEVVAQSARNMRAALRHQQYRYEDLRRALGLFHTDQQIAWTGVNIEPFDFDLSFGGHPTTAHNLSNGPVEDLTIFVYDRNDDRGLRIDFDANALLYEADDLQRHSERLVRMIESVAAGPDQPICTLPLFAAGERELVLGLRGPAIDADADPVAALEAWADRQPDALAAMGDGLELSYAALRSRVRGIAAALGAAGIGDGCLVALAPERGAPMVAALLGVLASGSAFLPLDPDGPIERTGTVLADARPAAMLASSANATKFGFTEPVDERIGLYVRPLSETDRLPAGTAYVIYTSGSTGTPKGVLVPRPALSNLLAGVQRELRLTTMDRLLAVTTLGFDIALLELLLPLTVGAAVVVASRPEVLDPRALTALIASAGINVIQATPSLWSMILAAGRGDALRGLTVMSGGEALPGHLAKRLHGLAGRLFNLYGPTETTIWSTIRLIGPDDLEAPTIGRPLANQHVYVLDSDGNPAPVGVVGELCIGGAGVSSGYLRREALSRERFVQDPFCGIEGARMYRTGDKAAVRSDGRIDYLGRNDDQIKLRGVRLEPGETEAALIAIAGVRQAAVMLRHDGGEARLCGYVVLAADAALAVDDLRRALLRKLPEAAIPTAWAILDALPLNSNGKLDRRALPPPEFANRAGYLAPRTEDEAMIAGIWAELFGLDQIGVHDNFFALGGDSLIAAQFIAEVSARSGSELSLGAMFDDATLESLAEQLAHARTGAGRQRDPFAELLPIRTTGGAAPLFCIQPVSGLAWGYSGLLRHVDRSQPIYGLQAFRSHDDQPDRPPTLAALASRYIDLIRTVQAAGPYHLLGFSFGGLVAHEMARQLEIDGETLAFLGLLDCYPYQAGAVQNEDGELVHAALSFLGLPADALGPDATIDDLVHHLTDVYDIGGRPVPREVGTPAQLVSRLRAVTEANLSLARAHRPGPVSSDAMFVRASDRTQGAAGAYIDDRPEAWTPFVRGSLDILDVACSHQEMLDAATLDRIGPYLARRLRTALRQHA